MKVYSWSSVHSVKMYGKHGMSKNDTAYSGGSLVTGFTDDGAFCTTKHAQKTLVGIPMECVGKFMAIIKVMDVC
jgi:hypothetical protein